MNEHTDAQIEAYYGKNVYGSPNHIEPSDEEEKKEE